ncbi:hypothetical protein GYMLUDRAFT_44845 [Collybiopsis luxurians FD-317 M1]|uniref:Unplaced genomic scaffold GYMLUscaffold_33, whole genome shotgun sequence n=1 Tax=Collybiopsis luxurians FD-317 M1 TaxID=944289 RepID=A0A0D0B6Q2_9AGAR|nr:hypothetical protein GYMLUDRAFT_44845 [Collybiopsis luxurians FD-317 M1]
MPSSHPQNGPPATDSYTAATFVASSGKIKDSSFAAGELVAPTGHPLPPPLRHNSTPASVVNHHYKGISLSHGSNPDISSSQFLAGQTVLYEPDNTRRRASTPHASGNSCSLHYPHPP